MKRIVNLFIAFCLPVLLTAQNSLELEWVREYTGDFELQDARAIALDDSGNVIIGITSFDTLNSYGFTTIKYNASGERIWLVKYEDANPESADHLRDISIDKYGNCYVTGSSEVKQHDPFMYYNFFVTIKYNSRGEKQWVATYQGDSTAFGKPNHIAVDGDCNVYVQGQYGKGILLKYDTNGNNLWKREFNNERVTGSYDKCMVMDDEANIYVSDKDFSVTKFDSSGNVVWNASIDSSDINKVSQSDITVDKKGNIYLAGREYNDSNSSFFVVKYNNYGTVCWEKTFGNDIYYYYRAKGVAVDSLCNVYVSGYVFADFAHDDKFITIKYDSSGNELWVEKCDGPVNTWGSIWNIGLDKLNNLNIVGQVSKYDTDNSDLAFLQYDSNGSLIFTDYYSENGRNEEAVDLAIDKKNNIYIIGESRNDHAQKVILLKYNIKPVSIRFIKNLLPDNTTLYQNYPNPFNSKTVISFKLPKTMNIRLKVYDLLGREIKTLIDNRKQAGEYKVVLNAENLASGIYIYRLITDEFTLSRKLVLIK